MYFFLSIAHKVCASSYRDREKWLIQHALTAPWEGQKRSTWSLGPSLVCISTFVISAGTYVLAAVLGINIPSWLFYICVRWCIYMPARSYSDACYTGWPPIDRELVYVVVARETCNNIYRSNSNSNHAAYTLYCTVVVNVAFYHGYVHSTVTSTFLCQQYASTRPALSSISAVCYRSRFLRGDRSDRIGSSGGRPASMHGHGQHTQRCVRRPP
jgi:hypothetical protein